MKKYLEDLRSELKKWNVSDLEIADILHDHEEMIQEALAEGLSEADIEKKFGDPEKVAKAICDLGPEKGQNEDTQQQSDWTLFQAFSLSQNPIKINVRLVEEDIRFEQGDVEQLKILYQGRLIKDRYKVEFKNNELVFSRNNDLFLFSRNDTSFSIVVPKKAEISELNHHSVSSDVEIRKMSAKIVSVVSTSGDLNLSDLFAEEMKLSTVSGDIRISTMIADNLNLSVVSGDASLNNTIVNEEMRINSVSGDLSIKDGKVKDATLVTVNGDISGNEFYPETVSLSTVSGDITIQNTDYTRPIMIRKKSTVSGDIHINSRN